MSQNKHTLLTNLAKLLSGRVLAALFSVMFIPVIARLYEPLDFGLAAIFVSVVSMIIPLSTLCYELAIVLPKDDKESNKLATISFNILVGVFLVLLLCIIVKEIFISVKWAETSIDGWLWLLPIAVFFVGAGNIFESLSIRYNQFTKIGVSEVSQSFAMPVVRIVWAIFAGSTVIGMIIGYIFGAFVRAYALFRKLPRKIQLFDKPSLESNLLAVANSYRDFPFFNLPSRFLRIFSNNLPILFFGAIFSPELVGIYAMALRLIKGPTEAISNVVRKVILKALSDKANNQDGDIPYYLLKIAIGMCLVGVLPYSILYIYNSEIILILLGPEWRNATQYIDILIPWFFAIWVTMPVSVVFVVFRQQKLWMMLQVLSAVARLIGFAYIYNQSLNIVDALTVFVFISVLMQIVILLSSFIVARHTNLTNQA